MHQPPRVVWEVKLPDGHIRCCLAPAIPGSSSIVVEDTGEELRREQVSGTESGAEVWAHHLRAVFGAYIAQRRAKVLPRIDV
jgi:hypothetical protein